MIYEPNVKLISLISLMFNYAKPRWLWDFIKLLLRHKIRQLSSIMCKYVKDDTRFVEHNLQSAFSHDILV